MRYLIVFGAGCAVAVFLIFWLVAIIVKKQPKKLVFWFIFFIMAGVCGVMTSAYTLAVCRTVAVVGNSSLEQYVVNDLFNMYASDRLASDTSVAPFVLYNFICQIIGIGVLGLIALVFLFAILTPFIAGMQLLIRRKYVAKPVEEKVEEEKGPSPEELARAKRRESLISYVEYEAGKEAREKEYEEICRAYGIPLSEDEEEEYYRETAASLPCLHGYEGPSDDDYYRETAAQLGCLHEEPVVEEPVESEEEYNERVAKELALFRLIKASQNAKIEKYYRDVIDELSIFSQGGEDEKNKAAISNLKRRAAEKRAYYEKLEKELPCLQYQKPPVEPDVSDDE